MSCLGTLASGLGCCLPAWVAEDPGMGGGGAGGGVRGPTGRCILRGLLSLSGVKLRPAGSGAERGQRTFRRSGSATKPGPGRARGAVAVAERRRGVHWPPRPPGWPWGAGQPSAPVLVCPHRTGQAGRWRGAGTLSGPRTLGRASGWVSEPIRAGGTGMPEGPLRDEAGTPARALRFFILARRWSLALPCRPRPCLAVSGARGLAPSLAHSEYEINARCAESDSFPMAPSPPISPIRGPGSRAFGCVVLDKPLSVSEPQRQGCGRYRGRAWSRRRRRRSVYC